MIPFGEQFDLKKNNHLSIGGKSLFLGPIGK